jgi:hypothetical protein
MKTHTNFMDTVKSSYMVLIIAMLGLFAFISAVLIAWSELAYLGAKMFNLTGINKGVPLVMFCKKPKAALKRERPLVFTWS